MAKELSAVINEALALDALSRAKLIDALYASLESPQLRERERKWARVGETRMDAYDRGQLGSESWDDLKGRLQGHE